jgi:hypothetical protein
MFGIFTGLTGVLGIRLGHCRNRKVATLLGIALAVSTLASSFRAGYESALRKFCDKNPEVALTDLRQQIGFSDWLKLRHDNGWTIKGWGQYKGSFGAAWLAEALWFLAVTVIAVREASSKGCYCEHCECWTSNRSFIVPGQEMESGQKFLRRGGLTGLLAMPPDPAFSARRNLVFRASICPRCDRTAYLSVDQVALNTEGGREKQHRTPWLVNVEIDQKQRAEFLARLARTPSLYRE